MSATVFERVPEDTEPEPESDDPTDDAALEDRTRELHRHLAATAEFPVDRTANRWLGEAEAVAGDVATSDLDAETVRDRVATVRRLLSEVDETGDEAADEHLEAAEALCEAILDP